MPSSVARAVEIRSFQPADWSGLWPILHHVFKAADTYSYPPDMNEAETRRIWIDQPQATFVAVHKPGQNEARPEAQSEDEILGSYILKPNQPGQGAHVCNCGYLVAPAARGHGIAAALCAHSQQMALAMGFRAMQFNMVAATNTVAVRLWQRCGFAIVGRLPAAFLHPDQGYVDAYVMYKTLR